MLISIIENFIFNWYNANIEELSRFKFYRRRGYYKREKGYKNNYYYHYYIDYIAVINIHKSSN